MNSNFNCYCRTCAASYDLYGVFKYEAYPIGWGTCGSLVFAEWPYISNQFYSCPAGYTSPYNNMGCEPCSAGSYGTAGTSLCVECEPGTSQDKTGEFACDACEAGKVQPARGATQCESCAAGQLSCQDAVQCLDECEAGTYKVTGRPQCRYCPAGKNTDVAGQTECYTCVYVEGQCVQECPAGYRTGADRVCEECPAGKYSALPAATACLSCLPGQYAAARAAACTTCLPGTYVDGLQCSTCPAGKYSCNSGCVDEPIFVVEGAYPTCFPCDGDVWGAGDACFRGDEPGRRKEFREGCSQSSAGSCAPCGERTACPAGEQWECRANKVGCFACAAGQYKSVAAAPACADCEAQCPLGMFAQGCGGADAGSCTRCEPTTCPAEEYYDCHEGGCQPCGTRGGVARCPAGQYVSGCGGSDAGACAECPLCYGQRVGCGGVSAGTCRRAAACAVEGYTRVGAHTLGAGGDAGECLRSELLGPTPLCALTAPGVRGGTVRGGLGGPGAPGALGEPGALGAPGEPGLLCSAPCDGRGSFDSQQCGGPWACRRAQCSAAGEPRACPVALGGALGPALGPAEEWKLDVACSPCAACGEPQAEFAGRPGWGRGCARECSEALCAPGEIFDWTDRACKPCAGLWDARLCGSPERGVSGNLRRVAFAGCRGAGAAGAEYGACSECANSCAGADEFPASGCTCQRCARPGARLAHYVDAAGHALPAFCQQPACGHDRTGVRNDGTLCAEVCARLACAAGERMVPCALPHDTRCVAEWPPAPDAGAGAGPRVAAVVPLSASLLERAADGLDGPRWASFENVLVNLREREQQRFQCVWNAAGIVDSVFAPAGVAAVFWAAKESAADEYRARGTKTCRAWPGGRHPLLPLQNALTFEGDAERRVLLNSSARVLSYAYDGTSTVEADVLAPRRSAGPAPDAGELLLAVDVHADPAHVLVHVPSDRARAPWARWWRLALELGELSKPRPAAPVVATVQQHPHVAGLAHDGLVLPSAELRALDAGAPRAFRALVGAREMYAFRSSHALVVSAAEREHPVGHLSNPLLALLWLGDPGRAAADAPRTVAVDVRLLNVPLAATALASGSPGGRCLALAATLAGLLCVGETDALVVAREQVQAAALVGFVTSAQLALGFVAAGVRGALQAFAVPEAPCSACECPSTALPLQAAAVGSVLGLARGPAPWQLVVLHVLHASLRADLFNATRGATVELTFEADLCQMESSEPARCALEAREDGLLGFVCVDSTGVLAVLCLRGAQRQHRLAAAADGGALSVAFFGSRALAGVGGDVFEFDLDTAPRRLVGPHVLRMVHFVRAGNALLLLDRWVRPEHGPCSGGWALTRLQAHVDCAIDDLGDHCLPAAPVSLGVRLWAVVPDAELVAPGGEFVLGRSAMHLDGAHSGEVSETAQVVYNNSERTVATQFADLNRTAAGGAFGVPTAVRRAEGWAPLGLAWELLLQELAPGVLLVFEATVHARCAGAPACTGALLAVESVGGVVRCTCLDADCLGGAGACAAAELAPPYAMLGAADWLGARPLPALLAPAALWEVAEDVRAGARAGLPGTVCRVALGDALRRETCAVAAGTTRIAVHLAAVAPHPRVAAVDELQLLPMLAERIPRVSAGAAHTDAYVPSAAELAAAGAGAADSAHSWPRVHVVVELVARGPCRATATLWRLADDGAPHAAQHGLQATGCALDEQAACTLAVPRDVLSASGRVRVQVSPGTCVARIDVSVPPLLAVRECAHDEFVRADGGCAPCGTECAPGTRVAACAQLSGVSRCEPCPALPLHAELAGAACAWRCVETHFRRDAGCVRCNASSCATGFFRAPCAPDADGECQPCPLAAHAEFVAGGPCAQRCRPGFFRSERGMCEACSTLAALNASATGPARFHNCSAEADAFAEPCSPPALGRYTARAAAFGVDCALECPAHLHLGAEPRETARPLASSLSAAELARVTPARWTGAVCVECPPARAPDGAPLPPGAYTTDGACNVTCLAPFRARGAGCVLCNASACAVGTYLAGCAGPGEPACRPCVARSDDFRFVSRGEPDRNASCAQRCREGLYDAFGLGTCVPVSLPACAAGEFLARATATADNTCRACSACAGARVVRPCAEDADAVCAPCGALQLGEAWGPNCSRACTPPFVLDTRSQACELCAHVCPAGQRTARPRRNCSHCEPCPPRPADAVWLADCKWACAVGFVREAGACAPLASNQPPAAAPSQRVRCPPGTKPAGVFACEPCADATVTPATHLENVTWTWRATGAPCQWHCKPPLVSYHIPGGAGVLCVSWRVYAASAGIAQHRAPPGVGALPVAVRGLERWEVLVAAAAVGVLAAVAVGLRCAAHH